MKHHITKLPPEITLMIADILDPIDAVLLSLTCKMLRDISEIYSESHWGRTLRQARRGPLIEEGRSPTEALNRTRIIRRIQRDLWATHWFCYHYAILHPAQKDRSREEICSWDFTSRPKWWGCERLTFLKARAAIKQCALAGALAKSLNLQDQIGSHKMRPDISTSWMEALPAWILKSKYSLSWTWFNFTGCSDCRTFCTSMAYSELGTKRPRKGIEYVMDVYQHLGSCIDPLSGKWGLAWGVWEDDVKGPKNEELWSHWARRRKMHARATRPTAAVFPKRSMSLEGFCWTGNAGTGLWISPSAIESLQSAPSEVPE
ncbi:hypothetical protein QBC44DRAFT_395425 [Cladorrhinum sp. PSN332]|nr:hypothetical protein QBC44DRAFT_395425 [Cladorrhinum sp. PSN332]